MKSRRKGSGGRILKLEGELGIQQAGHLKVLLLKEFAETDRLSLDVEAVTGMDVAGLQVLCAAHKTFLTAHKGMEIVGAVSPAYEQAINDSGYRRKIGCHADPERNCLWVAGGKP